MSDSKVLYHLGFGKDDLSNQVPEWVILSGDPSRAERIASRFLENAKLLSDHRGLKFFSAKTPSGKKLISATSGMGAPSMSIIVNELRQLGIKKIIRVGTTGAIQDRIQIADIVISQASLCRQGTANDIAPIEFPAAADPFLTIDLVESAKRLKIPYHLGVTASMDSFYEGQEREASANPRLLRRLKGQTDEFRDLGILNYEMESGSFFKMALVYGFQAACVCGVVAQRTQSEKVDAKLLAVAEERAILTSIGAIDQAD